MKKQVIYLMAACLLGMSCGPDFLEEKSNQKLLVPNTVEDFQLLLDNYGVMNRSPGLGLIGSDDFYITDEGYMSSIEEAERGAYIWDISNVVDHAFSEWRVPYEQVFYTNVVLDGLDALGGKETVHDRLRGTALFYRSYALFGLLQIFVPPYNSLEAASIPSVPFPASSDVNSSRPVLSMADAYARLIMDLQDAVELLPEQVTVKSRPSRLAALSLLARVHFLMGEYEKAEPLLEEAITLSPELLDYSTLNVGANLPFPTDRPIGPGNPEIIYYSPFIAYGFLFANDVQIRIDEELYALYDDDDLRRQLYFRDRGNGVRTFKGSYGGTNRSGDYFAGLSTDENYLNYAEVLVRNGKRDDGLRVLNDLLRTRYSSGGYLDYTAESDVEALDIILLERRKSLVGKGPRWFDIRRFNSDPDRLIKAPRTVLGNTYELSINDPRITFERPINDR